jgi:hypothetical protein
MDLTLSSQNLEPKELTRKMFWNKELAGEQWIAHFSWFVRKILIRKDLRTLDTP